MKPHERPNRSCARVREQLDLYIDGGLAPLAAVRDGGHLEACAACVAALGQRRAWLARVRDQLEPSQSERADLDRALLAQLGSAPTPRSSPWQGQPGLALRRAAPGLALAAAALLVLSLLPALLGDGALPETLNAAGLRSLVAGELPRVTWSADPLGPWMAR